jgi:fatty-acyl-CoA synthase
MIFKFFCCIEKSDVVRMNEHGYFHHESRLKDVVIRGGENIYPRELEEFLHQHEKIADVYVIGLPDKRMGEELCACVKLKSNEKNLTAEELRNYCKDKVNYKLCLD